MERGFFLWLHGRSRREPLLKKSVNRARVKGPDPFEIKVIRELDELRALRDEWSTLFESAGTKTLYQSHLWHDLWLTSYLRSDDVLSIITVRREGRLVGIAPFLLRNRKVNGLTERTLSLIGGQNFASDYCDLIAGEGHPEIVEAVVNFLFDHLPDWTYLDLVNLPGHSPHYEPLIRALKRRTSLVLIDKIADAPTLILNDYEAARGLLRKKSIKNKHNFLSKQGDLQFIELHACGRAESSLEKFFEQHIERWAALSKPSLFSNEVNRKFYRSLVKELSHLGMLRFCALELDGKPIAFHFGFELDRRFYYYKPTFDVGIREHSPGQVLLRFLLDAAITRELAEFDFTLGDEEYKYRFANTIRENFHVKVYRGRFSFWGRQTRTRLGRMKRLLLRKRRNRATQKANAAKGA